MTSSLSFFLLFFLFSDGVLGTPRYSIGVARADVYVKGRYRQCYFNPTIHEHRKTIIKETFMVN
jgi:hypothetical protein